MNGQGFQPLRNLGRSSRLRFALHRPGQLRPVSTRCHGPSGRDVACCVDVRVRLVSACQAPEHRLPLAVLRCDVLAGVAGPPSTAGDRQGVHPWAAAARPSRRFLPALKDRFPRPGLPMSDTEPVIVRGVAGAATAVTAAWLLSTGCYRTEHDYPRCNLTMWWLLVPALAAAVGRPGLRHRSSGPGRYRPGRAPHPQPDPHHRGGGPGRGPTGPGSRRGSPRATGHRRRGDQLPSAASTWSSRSSDRWGRHQLTP